MTIIELVRVIFHMLPMNNYDLTNHFNDLNNFTLPINSQVDTKML